MSVATLALWWAVAALGTDPDARVAVITQRLIVDELASEIAHARTADLDRDVLSSLMARYRDEAERLALLEAPELSARMDATEAERSAARRDLADALAKGTSDDRARTTLVTWLGEPAERLAALIRAFDLALATPDLAVRRGLGADVADQADVLALIASYDAAGAERDRDRAATQASSLRARTSPGQAGGMDLVVAAERLEREAAEAAARAVRGRELQIRAAELRAAALTTSRETP